MPLSHPVLRIECPTRNELRELIHNDLPGDRADEVTAHLSDCPGCQRAIDGLATGESPVLVEAVRHIDRIDPPRHSALWPALDHSISVITRVHAKDATQRAGDLKLDFLSRSTTPGRIGRLGGFEVNRVIGRGGMGVVLHAFDPVLQRDVALKILDPQLAGNDTARQRFCREARAAASVTSENIVTIHQVDEDAKSGLPFLVMQLVAGESLEQRLRRVKKLSVPDAVRLGAQAAAGLAAAHATGLIHRDVKPGNILLEAGTDRVKLTDFGLARAAEDLKLTKTGFVSGTPLYMAPEQARGDDVDHRGDLFSLGVVLYEAVTGQPPFDGKTPLAVLRRVADEPHTPVHKLSPDVPEWFEEVIDRLLAKEPADRFQTAADLHAVLDAHVVHPSSPQCDAAAASHNAEACPFDPPSNLSRRARRQWQARLVGLMTVPLLAGVFLGLLLAWASGLFSTPGETVVVAGEPPPPVVREVVTHQEEPVAKADAAFQLGGSVEFQTDAPVWSVGTCPDGTHLAVGLEDGSVRIYDLKQKKLALSVPAHKGPVWGLDFFPRTDSGIDRFVTVSDDGIMKVWDLTAKNGKVDVKQFKAFEGTAGVRAVAVNQHGTGIVTGDRGGKVKVWNLEAKPTDKPAEFDHGGTVTAVAFSKDDIGGGYVASAGVDKTVKVWDVPNRRQFGPTLLGHKGPVFAVTFSNTGVLATAGWDGGIRLWDVDTLAEKPGMTGHAGDIGSLAFTDCGQVLASGGHDGTVRLWDVGTGKLVKRLKAHASSVHVVRWTKDCKTVISGGRDGFVRLWDAGR